MPLLNHTYDPTQTIKKKEQGKGWATFLPKEPAASGGSQGSCSPTALTRSDTNTLSALKHPHLRAKRVPTPLDKPDALSVPSRSLSTSHNPVLAGSQAELKVWKDNSLLSTLLCLLPGCQLSMNVPNSRHPSPQILPPIYKSCQRRNFFLAKG